MSGGPKVGIVVAITPSGVIGRSGALPWRLPADLRHFRDLTLGAPIVMGRRTYESIGRPLKGRTNLVVTRNPAPEDRDVIFCASLSEALERVSSHPMTWIIGGSRLYGEALPLCDTLEITWVLADIEGDTFFPPVDWTSWELIERRDLPRDVENTYELVFSQLRRTGASRLSHDGDPGFSSSAFLPPDWLVEVRTR